MTVGCCDERVKKTENELATFQDEASERGPTSAVPDELSSK